MGVPSFHMSKVASLLELLRVRLMLLTRASGSWSSRLNVIGLVFLGVRGPLVVRRGVETSVFSVLKAQTSPLVAETDAGSEHVPAVSPA